MFKVVNDSATVLRKDVGTIVRELCVSYSDLRRSFSSSRHEIEAAIDAGEVTEAVKLMVKVYRLPPRFLQRIGYSAKINGEAALHTMIDPIQFKPVRGVMYFRFSRAKLSTEPSYRLMHMIAHELTHARMRFDMHPHMLSEFATDVVALLVTGDSAGYQKAMICSTGQYGYIRPDLHHEVFRCLNDYSDAVYLK
jgi:hypothetical protein